MVRRLIPIAGASLLALLPFAAPAAAAPRASASLDRCHPSLDAVQRYASFSGSMRSLRGGQDRMDMRFDLFRRAAGALFFKRVAAPGLGVWNHANPGVGRFKFRQKVENLTAPAAYRAVVSFRWINGNGRVFARAQHVTFTCHQPLPDLRIIWIKRSAGTYRVAVGNAGGLASPGFDVSLSVDGRPVVPTETADALGPFRSLVLTFDRPGCAGRVVATADSGRAVPESNEANNTLTTDCTSIATTSSR